MRVNFFLHILRCFIEKDEKSDSSLPEITDTVQNPL